MVKKFTPLKNQNLYFIEFYWRLQIKMIMILDPFLGSGTTATVAKKLGRNYYGIEKEKNYFKAAEQRLKDTKPIEDDFLDTLKNNRSKPRIPFGSLVELGIIKARNKYF